jgi:hypothetical protein
MSKRATQPMIASPGRTLLLLKAVTGITGWIAQPIASAGIWAPKVGKCARARTRVDRLCAPSLLMKSARSERHEHPLKP